ncbi:MAG: M28 family peptidase [Gemmatimonadota bacterium]|nr:MAG: M28 family peptidase [Gemmatimonadota bacterium]
MTGALRFAAAAVLLLAAACQPEGQRAETAGGEDRSTASSSVAAAVESITDPSLRSHIEVLASDEFEGRAPGTEGERLTVDYLVEQFRQFGLAPGNPDGSYVQEVPLVGLTADVTEASFVVGGAPVTLSGKDDFTALTSRVMPEVSIHESEIVFVGYGVVAPEYDWDDFKDVDVSGKTILVLVNDPPIPDPDDPERLDPEMFNGRAMTYYGRWTYKYEIAAEKGAAAVFVIHEAEPAGYPWEVPSASWGREEFEIAATGEDALEPPAINGWMHLGAARRLFEAAGLDYEEQKRAALEPGFRPVDLGGTASLTIRNEIREIRSQNVIAKLEGADPDRRGEYVIYTAHWDHLGKNPSLPGDQIYNGAKDNASGTAGLLEIARAFSALETPPGRSIVFLAVTAEEKGLLGARFYAQNPLYPLASTLANINMDGANLWGRTEDIVVVGLGNSTLDGLLATAAAEMGRVIEPDAEPEKGFFYRSDHFEFAKLGVPALYVDEGTRFIGKPEGYGEEKRREYTAEDYHKPSDEIKPDWDLSGAVDDFRLLFLVGYAVAENEEWPEWNPGTEFKATREAMLGESD